MQASELKPGQLQQRVTLAKRGTVIMLHCEDYDHADKVYDWLETLAHTTACVLNVAEPTPAPLQLREGAYYRRRDAVVVGSAKPSLSKKFPWTVGDGGYTDDGRYNEAIIESAMDLIAEVQPPVEPAPEQFVAGDLVVCGNKQIGANESLDADVPVQIDSVSEDGVSLVFVGRKEHYFADNFRRATPEEIAAYKQAQEPQPDADGPTNEEIETYLQLTAQPQPEPPQPITDWTIEVWR